MFPVPIRALLSILPPSPPLSLLCLYSSHLFRSFSPSYSLSPLIRRNFHRKFSRQAQSATPEAAARSGSECSVVFISAPNEFAGRSSHTHTLIAATPRHAYAATQRTRLDGARNGAARRDGRRTVGWLREVENGAQVFASHVEGIGIYAPTGFLAFSPRAVSFFSASRLRRAS